MNLGSVHPNLLGDSNRSEENERSHDIERSLPEEEDRCERRIVHRFVLPLASRAAAHRLNNRAKISPSSHRVFMLIVFTLVVIYDLAERAVPESIVLK